MSNYKYKTIFSLKIHAQLRELGFEPLFESENKQKPGYKCWVYLITPKFQSTLDSILGGEIYG